MRKGLGEVGWERRMTASATLDICSLSDLHLDYQDNWKVAEAMAYKLIDLSPDVLILAGDVASLPQRVKKVLAFFEPLATDVLFVPGNHDLWAPTKDPEVLKGVNTWDVYTQELREMCEALGVHYLPRAPFVKGDLAIVGTCGWYDYSMASALAMTRYDLEDFTQKGQSKYRWVDALRVRWRDGDGQVMSDADVARQLEADLAEQLASLGDGISRIVGVSHHVPFKDACFGHRGLAGDFFTAYMGSTGIGDVFAADPRVETVIFGHQHRPVDQLVDVGGRSIKVLSTPLGTPRDWSGEPKDVAKVRMGRIRL